MEWVVALLVFVAVLALTVWFVRRPSKGKGRLGGAVLAIGLAFSTAFDPPSKAAHEEIDKNKGKHKREEAEGPE